MENKLEELLNSLIEKGWKPFGFEAKEYKISIFNIRSITLHLYHTNNPTQEWIEYSIRNIVSRESGLWQFVCENGMYKKEALGLIFNDERAKNVFYKIDQFDEEGDVIQTGDMGGDEFIHISEPEYRLIESALRDESGLEQFLLDNIKIDE